MATILDTIATFVPTMVLERANAGTLAITEPTVEFLPAAALFVDVTGFTALSEKLAERGPGGAEDLTTYLNAYFGPLLDIIQRYGGDTVKFAGDALLALWPVTDGETLEDTAQLAAECALAVQHELKSYRVGEDTELTLKMTLAAGDVAIEYLGGVFDRWELLITGDPVSQVAAAQHQARPGEVVMTIATAELLGARAQTEPLPDNTARLTAMVRRKRDAIERPRALPHTLEPLRRLLPGAIRGRIEAGHQDWLGELRHLSVIFINLPGFTYDLPVERAQEAMRAMQSALYRFEGSINKISVDDKGASLVALLGLPPLSHTDDAERAVHAAQLMHGTLRALGFESSIGITTGRAFCGAVGSSVRREYTVMGDVVNLAARLMLYAEHGILCDESTARTVSGTIECKPLGAITVKGKSAPVPIYLPKSAAEREWRHAGVGRRDDLVGRDHERQQLRQAVAALGDAKPVSVVIEGETGVGKTRLLLDLLAHAEAAGCAVLTSAADPVERATPYFMWRAILRDLFAIGPADDADTQRMAILNQLPDDAEVIENAPLLGDVLALDWPDNTATGALSPRERAEQAHLVICRIIERLARRLPLILIAKDVQWLDSASWELLHQVRSRVPRLLVVIALRAGEVTENLARFRRTPHRRILLQGLAREDLNLMLSRRLKVETLPRDIVGMIHERTNGNPFYAEELVRTLFESGQLHVDRGTGDVTYSGDSAKPDLPRNLQSAITMRIDRLPPDAQLTLKVASVLGRLFTAESLAAVYPAEASEDDLAGHLETLERAELVGPLARQTFLHADGGGRSFKFANAAIQETAYDLMLFAQRRRLHAAAADWLEASVVRDKTGHAAVIAMHRERALDLQNPNARQIAKAIEAYEQAAQRAERVFANREAIAAYRAALALLEHLPDDDARAQRELGLLLSLGGPLIAATSYADRQVQTLYERARNLAGRVGGHTDLFRALRGMWQYEAGEGRVAAARELSAEMIRIAEASQDPVLLIEANRTLGNNAFFTGNFADAQRYLEAAIAPYDAGAHAGLAANLGQDPDVANRGILSWALCFLGKPDAALDQATRAVDRAETLDHPFSKAFAYGAMMWCHKFLWQPEQARDWAERCLSVCTEHGIPYLEVAARVVRGWALATQGDRNVIDAIEAAIDRWRTGGASIGTTIFLIVLAESAHAAGMDDIARASLSDPQIVARNRDERWLEAETHCVAAELDAARDPVRAARAFRAAHDLAAERGAVLTALRAAIGLARLSAKTRRARGGADLLRAAMTRFGPDSPAGIMGAARDALGEIDRRGL